MLIDDDTITVCEFNLSFSPLGACILSLPHFIQLPVKAIFAIRVILKLLHPHYPKSELSNQRYTVHLKWITNVPGEVFLYLQANEWGVTIAELQGRSS